MQSNTYTLPSTEIGMQEIKWAAIKKLAEKLFARERIEGMVLAVSTFTIFGLIWSSLYRVAAKGLMNGMGGF